jgi:hypothetical protein
MSNDKKNGGRKVGKKGAPLVEAVVAHEVDAGEIQGSATLRALCGMEQPRVVGIGEFLDLLKLRSGLEPIRRSQLLVLHTT